ncbi:LysR family transcriptional regulator [Amycolatopsis umgeniensis]|uniref:DNA-binding transcriptional LysR family regulator n=1 Tax=Amycolatopsis umgeniensis TaxID=336628 RepID=A0A841B2Y4_9PSEU|nr:LysR substrate-binding domain-containing protein [Amycolatopsis umgeniensis]MBB5853085.1 DNA-binding transcriptional LysR family regulator [Amycolatopsis umgeniensis]
MELRQLEYFVAVAEEANFTRAAERLHVAQPGVSAQIRRLERELGQPLLDRSARAVRLTEVGAAALPHARAALAAVAGVRQSVDDLTGLVRGQVAMGMVSSRGPVNLPDLLERFHERHPAVDITLAEATSDVLLAGVADGRFDIALIGLSGEPPPGIGFEVVLDEPLVAISGPDDPLTGQATITLSELESRSLVSLPKGTGMRAIVDAAFLADSARPRVTLEAGDPNVVAELVGRGLGVAVVPMSLATYYTKLHAMEITRPAGLRAKLALAWRTEGPVSPAARVFISQARALLGL